MAIHDKSTTDMTAPAFGRSKAGRPGANGQIELFGLRIDNITVEEVFDRVDARIATGTPGYVVTPNVDHVCRYHTNKEFKKAINGSFLTLTDGVPVIWASRMVGTPIREKISGSDLIYWLSEHCAAKGYSVFLFGAADGVADKAAERLKRLYPGLRIAGCYSPPMGFEKQPEALEEALDRLRRSRADVCFIAMGSPRQEIWMAKNAPQSEIPVLLGTGAAIDFVAGRLWRAPRFLQRMGLEWFWRLLFEPRRLARRYLVEDLRFFVLMWREIRMKRLRFLNNLRTK